MTCKASATLSRWARVGSVAVAAAVFGLTTSAFGQNTCNPQLNISLNPPATNYAVGQEITINIDFGTGSINGGTNATINTLTILLDCTGATAADCIGNNCSNTTNPYISYNGDASIVHNLNCGGAHTVASNSGGGTGVNPLVFTFTPGIVLPPNSTCSLSFKVTVQDLGGLNAHTVRGRVTTSGLCNNDLSLGGCATYSYGVVQPQINIVKTVAPTGPICEGTQVKYTYHVTNPGTVPLTNVVVIDDNATPGNLADDFEPDFVGGDTGNDGILTPGEDWEYTHTATLAAGTHTNIAVVEGDFVSGGVTTTVTDDDDAVIVVVPPPSCAIDDNELECAIELCAVTDACSPTYLWSGPGGFTSTAQCIILDASDPAGAYCVRVTDCNGCISGGQGTSCCYNFVPPITPSCSISSTECPFPRTLTVTVNNCPGCSIQWGTGTAGACTDIPGETGTTLIINSPGTYCVKLTSDEGCTGGCDIVIVECPTGGHGRTPGFWKQEHHWGHWPDPYCAHDDCPCGPATLFCEVFDCTTSGGCQAAVNDAYAGKTLLEVLGQGGGGFYALGRHAVAALLNSAHNELDYAFTTAEVISMTNTAIDDCNPNPTKNQFAQNNELGGGTLGGQLYCAALFAGYGSTWPDFNADGKIDGADMSILLSHWGPYTGTCDLHPNNKINNKDVVIMVYLMAQYAE